MHNLRLRGPAHMQAYDAVQHALEWAPLGSHDQLVLRIILIYDAFYIC